MTTQEATSLGGDAELAAGGQLPQPSPIERRRRTRDNTEVVSRVHLPHTAVSLRRFEQAAWDFLAWMVAAPLALLLRFDGSMPVGSLGAAVGLGVVCGTAQVALGYAMLLYRGRYRFGSFDEVLGVVLTDAIVTIGAFAAAVATQPPGLPRATPLIAGALALVLMLGGRFLLRAYRQRFRLNQHGERTLIYGAGDSGYQLVKLMVADPSGPYTPVGFLDDDPDKSRLHITGKRVLGTNEDLEQVVRRTGATTLVVAIAHVDSKQLLDLDRRCTGLGIHLRVIPSTAEIVNGAVKLGDISHVTEEDLLGRRPIDTDEEGIREFLEGKRILITGAGGSIGSELARQVHRYNPAFVGILDRDESAMHAVQLSIDGRGLLSGEDLILADIRDECRMHEVMQLVRPEIVFHAAALKHLSLLERYPEEGHKTNVLGTGNVLRAARAVGVVDVRQHLDRQGRRPHLRARPHQADDRAPDRRHGPAPDRARPQPLPLRALRQRARQPWLGAHRLPLPDREGRAGHRHRTPT